MEEINGLARGATPKMAISFEEDYPLNKELAEILGLNAVPEDDSGDPYEIRGIDLAPEVVVFLEGSRNLSVGHDTPVYYRHPVEIGVIGRLVPALLESAKAIGRDEEKRRISKKILGLME